MNADEGFQMELDQRRREEESWQDILTSDPGYFLWLQQLEIEQKQLAKEQEYETDYRRWHLRRFGSQGV